MEFVLVLVLIATLLPAGVLYRGFTSQAWIEAANSLGLNRNPGSPKTRTWISGPVRGVYVDVRMIPRGKQGWFTTYKITYQSAGPDVRFRQQGRLSSLRRLIGGRDVLIDDANFDDSVIVDTTDSEAVTTFLTPARRAAILAILGQWSTAEIGYYSIEAKTRHIERSADRIVTTVNQLVDTALLFATPARSEIAPDVTPASVDIEEIEPFVAEVAEGPVAIDADPVVVNWREVDNRQLPITTTTPTVAGSDEARGEIVELDLSQEAVIDDLLGSGLMGFEIETRFASSYEGRAVTWFGEVATIRKFRNDADFGEGPGTKVSIRIGCLDNSSLVSKQVHAVLRLPTDGDLNKGEDISFTGTLLRIDRHTRKILVTDARLADAGAPIAPARLYAAEGSS